MKPGALAPAPPRLGWRDAVATLRSEPAHTRILGGSIIMLLGSGLVSAVNFGYNVAIARLLGPTAFGHAAAAVTLLMLVSAITLSFQLVCAKLVAKTESKSERAAIYSALLRRSWGVGLILGTALLLASGPVSRYLNLPSPFIVVLLALGIAFYIPLGTKRGGMQGTCEFTKLSWNFFLEAATKFCGAMILIAFGYGVYGAVAAISISVVLAYFIPPTSQELRIAPGGKVKASFREGMQAIVFFTGQVVINNIDILLVKHFFSPDSAGQYAAVALVGRVIYFASWSVVSAMFPISAAAQPKKENVSVLVIPILIVLGITVIFIAGLTVFPDPVLRAVFGSGFQGVAKLDGLLSLYAAATGTYSLGVVLMAYEMSRRIANTGWLQLAVSGAIVVGIYLFHNTLQQVVLVQLVLMVGLLMIVSIPFFRHGRHSVLEEAA
jgi:O-antigen/teichoic acid export membrane protein